MLKWLDKVTSNPPPGKPATPVARPFEPQKGPPSRPAPATATPRRVAEPPLPVPRVDLSDSAEAAFEHGIVSRQVLIDRAYHPIGYEFSLSPDSAQSGENSAQMVVALVARLGGERLAAGRQAWRRLSAGELAGGLLATLDPTTTVLVVDVPTSGNQGDDLQLQQARRLRARGFPIALANWSDTPRHRAWLAICRFVEVDLARASPVEAGEWPEKLAKLVPGISVVARGVDNWEELEFCHRAGYDLFRGHFLTRRENWPRQPKTNPERARICNLLNRLHAGAELKEISEQLRQSPELSYRLLRYINSAGVGLAIRIASVQQGLVVLGRDKTYRWLTVLLFSSGPGKSLDSALLEQALVRARMIERLAGPRFSRVQAEELFVVGIFSLLDVLLKLPMSVALEPLKLPDTVQQALLGSGGEYLPFLNLAVASEETNSEQLKLLGEQLGVSLATINAAQLDALVWAQQTLSF
jgi:c-di-GMP phosphodiesterase